MNIEQAKANLQKFLGDTILTFSIKTYPDGEWVAECNEMPAIMTGGMGDIAEMDRMIRDAILAAAGISADYAEKILKFVDLKSPYKLFRSPISSKGTREAEYVIA